MIHETKTSVYRKKTLKLQLDIVPNPNAGCVNERKPTLNKRVRLQFNSPLAISDI